MQLKPRTIVQINLNNVLLPVFHYYINGFISGPVSDSLVSSNLMLVRFGPGVARSRSRSSRMFVTIKGVTEVVWIISTEKKF